MKQQLARRRINTRVRKSRSVSPDRLAGRGGYARTAILELIEERLCLASMFEYSLVAQTGSTLSQIQPYVSVNDNDNVAFVALDGSQNSGVYMGTSTAPPALESFPPGQGTPRDYGLAASINDGSSSSAIQIAARDQVHGSLFSAFERRWTANGSQQNPIDVATSSQIFIEPDPENFSGFASYNDINNNNQVVFVGLDASTSTTYDDLRVRTSVASAATQPNGGISNIQIGDFPANSGLRPQISDTGEVVFRSISAASIFKTDPESAKFQRVAGAHEGFLADGSLPAVGESPGITSDGKAVAFYGNRPETINARSAGHGIFLSLLMPGASRSGGVTARQIVRIAGIPGELGTDASGNAFTLQDFSADSRVGVSGTLSLAPNSTSKLYVTFIANDPLHGNAKTLWEIRLNVLVDSNGRINFHVQPLEDVAQVGDTVRDNQANTVGTIQDLQVYHPVNNQGALGYWITMTSGQQAVVLARRNFPLVVDVVSPGFNPAPEKGQSSFFVPFEQLAAAMEAIPAPGSALDGRVASYVPEWDSTSSFRSGFSAMLLSYVATAESELQTDAGNTSRAALYSQAATRLSTYAASTAASSDARLIAAAVSVVQTLTQVGGGYLLAPDQSNMRQVINLVGHSRGAELNAYIALVLFSLGYHNIADFVSLDGYSQDWSNQTPGSGALTHFNITSLLQSVPISNGAFNFRAVQGLAYDALVQEYVTLAISDATLSRVKSDTDLRAPSRSAYDSFIDIPVPGHPPNPGTTHTDITEEFYANLPTLFKQYGYLYAHADAPLGSSLPSPQTSNNSLQSVAAAASTPMSGTAQLSSLAASAGTVANASGFLDGTIEALGAIDLQNQAASSLTTGDPLIDGSLQSIASQAHSIALSWDTTGHVTLARSSGNTALQLDESSSGSSSVAQTIVFPDGAHSVEFDMDAQNAAAGDTLCVLLDGNVLESLNLTTAAANGHQSIVLPADIATTGTITFQLQGRSSSPVTMTLDNIAISVNHPPALAPLDNQVVTAGSAVSFAASATDPDAGQTLTYSLGQGAPLGATIDATSGAFNWTPTAAQGGQLYNITVRVTDNGSPPASYAQSFVVNVIDRLSVTAVTEIAPPTPGPLQVALDFNEAVQASVAQNIALYKIGQEGTASLPIQSAVYVDSGTQHRVVLTVSAATPVIPGYYHVSIDAAALSATNGDQGAPKTDQLWVDVTGENNLKPVTVQPDGTFAVSPPEQSLGYSSPTQVIAGNFTGSGRKDLIAITQGYKSEYVNGNDVNVYEPPLLFRNNGDGTYAPPAPIDLGSFDGYSVQVVLTVDWNHDGFPDLVAGVSSGPGANASHAYLVLLNDGHGTFTNAPETPIPVSADSSLWLNANGFAATAVYDLNGNGQYEILHPTSLTGGSIEIIGKDPFIGYSPRMELPVPNNEGVTGFQFADLNSDGKADVIMMSGGASFMDYYTPTASVFLATASGYSTAHTILAPLRPGTTSIGSFSGPGSNDIATLYDNFSNYNGIADGDVIQVATNDGSGAFTVHDPILLNRRDVVGATFGDVNNDGITDLVMVLEPNGPPGTSKPVSKLSVWTFLGDGHGGFTPSTPAPIPLACTDQSAPSSISLVDLDGDGYPDLLLGSSQSGEIRTAINDGAGTMRPPMQAPPFLGASAVQSIVGQQQQVFADFNNDGRMDFAIQSNSGLEVYLAQDDGSFKHTATLPGFSGWQLGSASGRPVIGDLNNDGIPDLMTATMTVYLGNGDGTFRQGPSVASAPGYGIKGVTLADVNGDGNLDAIVALTHEVTPGDITYTVLVGYGVAFGDGKGNLTFNANTIVGASTPSDINYVQALPVLADFNGDHVPDVLVPSGASWAVALGVGNGTFKSPIALPAPGIGQQFLVKDLNGDGIPDIVALNSTEVDVYLGNGQGGFSTPLSIDIGIGNNAFGNPIQPANIALGDFRGDGKLDLAVSYNDYYASPNVVNILPGDGSGHFGAPQSVTVGTNPFTLVTAPRAPFADVGSFALTDHAPVANDIETPTMTGDSVVIPVMASVSHADPGQLTLSAVSMPAHGTAHIDNNATPNDSSDDTIVYTPAATFAGSDSFTYTVTDAAGVDAVATISVTVPGNPPSIISVAAASMIVGTPGSFRIVTAGKPKPSLTETGVLPSGLSFDGNTGLLSGTPAPGTGGTYNITFTANNGAGTSAVQGFLLTVNQPLAPAFTSAPGATFLVGNPNSFTVTASGWPKSSLSESGTLPAGVSFDPTTGILSGTPTNGGTFSLTFTATNGVGSDAVQTFTLQVNTVEPAITSAASASFYTGTGNTFQPVITGAPPPSLSESGALPSGISFDPTRGIYGTPAANAIGTYPITFRASNGVGSDAVQNFTLTVGQGQFPTLAISPSISNPNFIVGELTTFNIVSTGAPTPTLFAGRWPSIPAVLPAGISFDPTTGILSGIAQVGSEGAYNIEIDAVNGVTLNGYTGNALHLTLIVTDGPAQTPNISFPSANQEPSFAVGISSTYALMITGNPKPALSQSFGSLPPGIMFDPTTGVLSGVPQAGSEGAYLVDFDAQNAFGGDVIGVTIFVGDPQPPAITTAAHTSFVVGTAGTFSVNASGLPTSQISESGALPVGVTFDAKTGMLTGVPGTGTVGTYSITFTAHNGVGSDAVQSFTLTVNQLTAPQITSDNAARFRENTSGTFNVIATGWPIPSVAEGGDLPAGISFDAATGLLYGQPITGAAGTYPITFTAHNGVGNDAVQNFTITVESGGGQPPHVADDVYVISTSQRSAIDAAHGVLANDFPVQGLTSRAGTMIGSEGGTFALRSDGSFTYTQPVNFAGFDYAEYTAINSGGDIAQATVNVVSQPGGVVWKFYESVLGRVPDYGGLQFWINDFVHGGKTGDIAIGFFESDELLDKIIGGYYKQYLGRTLDENGLAFWKQQWRTTGGPELIKAGFAASPEFKNNAGNTPDGWLTALYQRILNRTSDPQGYQFWQQQLADGVPEFDAALGFFDSSEAYQNDVTGWFNEYLGRAPSNVELQHYAIEMTNGNTDRDIEQEITNLPEYGQNPPTTASGTAVRLPDYFQQSVAENSQALVAAKDSIFTRLGA